MTSGLFLIFYKLGSYIKLVARCLPDGCPLPDVYIYFAPDMINVWGTVSTYIHSLCPRMFFLNNGLDSIQRTIFLSDYIRFIC